MLNKEKIREHIEEIQRRAAAATPGPWSSSDFEWGDVDSQESDLSIAYDIKSVDDNVFIASARADVPWLCEQLLEALKDK